MRGRGVGCTLLVCTLSVLNCSPITARQARLREAGRGVQPRPAPTASAADLARAADALPDPQRLVVTAALSLLGTPERDLDCSTFVVRAYAAAGVALPRTVREQLHVGDSIDPAALLPGDLVFFCFERRPADHVGLYVGSGQMVHVSDSAGCVQLVPLGDAALAAAQVAARRPTETSRARPGRGV